MFKIIILPHSFLGINVLENEYFFNLNENQKKTSNPQLVN